jgi:hypothetical protein
MHPGGGGLTVEGNPVLVEQPEPLVRYQRTTG